jgi:hypothetical protein
VASALFIGLDVRYATIRRYGCHRAHNARIEKQPTITIYLKRCNDSLAPALAARHKGGAFFNPLQHYKWQKD